MKKRNVFLLFLVLIAPTLLSARSESQTKGRSLVLTHVTVIDATGAAAKADMTVVIAGDRITEIGKSGKVRFPQNAQVVDATGKFLIPGLWDMHVHWEQEDYLPLFIANGVTGIRIMWGDPIHHQWRKRIESGNLLGPRMSIASAIIDGPKPVWKGSVAVSNAEEGRQAVIKEREQGVDFIKVYSRLPRDAYFAIADEAKKEGIPFAGHVPSAISAAEASDAGQKSIEHLTGILFASSRDGEALKAEMLKAMAQGDRTISGRVARSVMLKASESYDDKKAADLFEKFKQHHTWQVPTLTVLRSSAYMDDPNFTNDPRLKYMPPSFKDEWKPENDFRFKAFTAEDWANAKKVYAKYLKTTGAMRRAGVEFLAGTDVSNPYCFPGFSLHDELVLLVEAGFTPMEALQAATRNPARYLGREKELGTIEVGKLADLVLLDANPLQEISNTKKINAVVVNGRLLERVKLDQMLAGVEALNKAK